MKPTGKPPIPDRVAERLLKSVKINDYDCWITDYSVGSHGYAQLNWSTNGVHHLELAHRVMWRSFISEIPAGMTVDHMCRVRKCVNPRHLRLLTNAENGRLNGHAVKTHCIRGHPFSGSNLITTKQGRKCRACKEAQQEKRNAERRAERASRRTGSCSG